MFSCPFSNQTLLYYIFFQLFREAIKAAYAYQQNPTDYVDQVLAELEVKPNLLFLPHKKLYLNVTFRHWYLTLS